MATRPAFARRASGQGLRFEELAVALLVVAGLELLILRTFTRTAIHIPALQQLSGPYKVLSSFGRYDYYVAVVALIALLPVAGVSLRRRCGFPGTVAAAGVTVFALSAAAARAGIVGDIPAGLLSVGALMLMTSAAVSLKPAAMLPLVAFAAASTLSASNSLLQSAAEQGYAQVDGRNLLWSAEVLACVFGIAAPFALKVPRTRSVMAVGIGMAVLTYSVLLGGAATAKILMLWNEGLNGALPALAYALATGGLSASLYGLARSGRGLTAVGLALVICGGIGLHSTYQTGLVIAGFATMCIAWASAAPTPRAVAPGLELTSERD